MRAHLRSGIEVCHCPPPGRGTAPDDCLPEDRDLELRMNVLKSGVNIMPVLLKYENLGN